ncbi:hypothetical protein EDD22DRAFT_961272 [Suillus occidentalis]|nr:hypothetical protein EDD22DRAFT_961272 [Suillus occidentalis]
MPCTNSSGSSVTSGSTRSFKSVSSPPTFEAPHSSPVLKSNSSRLRASISVPPSSEAPDSSPILKGRSSSLRASSPAILNIRVGSPVTPVKVPTSASILRSSFPIPSSSPILRGSSPITRAPPLSPITRAPPLLTTMFDEGSLTISNNYSSCKRSYQYSLLPSDGLEVDEHVPMKKSKLLLTSRMLELSHIGSQTFAAKLEYQRLHTEELELMASLTRDEMKESQVHLTKIDLQTGLLRNSLHDVGIAVIETKGRKDARKEIGNSRLFPGSLDHEADDSSDPYHSSVSNSSGCNGSVDEKWGS